jgi:hypothetical protein
MAEPTQPDRETREHLLGVLAELIAKGGGQGGTKSGAQRGVDGGIERFLMPPVAPGADGPIGRAVEEHLRFQSSSTTGSSVQSRLGARGRYGA